MTTPLVIKVICFASLVLSLAHPAGGAERVSFNRQIRPLLSENCLKCHGGVKEAGGLNLQFREEALKPGKSDLRGGRSRTSREKRVDCPHHHDG